MTVWGLSFQLFCGRRTTRARRRRAKRTGADIRVRIPTRYEFSSRVDADGEGRRRRLDDDVTRLGFRPCVIVEWRVYVARARRRRSARSRTVESVGALRLAKNFSSRIDADGNGRRKR